MENLRKIPIRYFNHETRPQQTAFKSKEKPLVAAAASPKKKAFSSEEKVSRSAPDEV